MTLQILLDDARKEERVLGRAEGLEEGRAEGAWLSLIQQVCKKLEKGKSVMQIAEELEEEEEKISKIVEAAHQYTSNYDVETIYKKIVIAGNDESGENG